MRSRSLLPILCASLLAAAPGVAQTATTGATEPAPPERRFEVTPFLGLLVSDSLDSIGSGPKIDIDEDLDFGLALSFPTRFDFFQVELIYSRYHMDLAADRPGTPRVTEVSQRSLHLGGLWELTDGRHRGYATAAVGVVELDPEGRFYSTKSLPSISLGGGGKLYFHDRVGLRLDGRLLGHVADGKMFCNPTAGCVGLVSSSLLVQLELSAGLIIRF